MLDDMRGILVVTTLSFFTLPSWAYVPTRTGVTSKPTLWARSNCVMMRLDSDQSKWQPSQDNELPYADVLTATRNAMANWKRATSHCSYLELVLLDSKPGLQASFNRKGENENVITFVSQGWVQGGRDSNVQALTTTFFIDDKDSPRDGMLLDADIEVNTELNRFSARSGGVANRYDLESTLTHELGHVLGLDHPCFVPAPKKPDATWPTDHEGNQVPNCSSAIPAWMKQLTMYNFGFKGSTVMREPKDDDVLGICSLYPKPSDPGQCIAADPLTRDGCQVAPNGQSPGLVWLLLFLGLFSFARRRRRKR
jgi:MYXO-CTERM domain-containing protein